MVSKRFDKTPAAGTRANFFVASTQTETGIIFEIQLLAEELHKLIVRKFKKVKYTHLLTIIYIGCGLTDMQLIRKYNKRI